MNIVTPSFYTLHYYFAKTSRRDKCANYLIREYNAYTV